MLRPRAAAFQRRSSGLGLLAACCALANVPGWVVVSWTRSAHCAPVTGEERPAHFESPSDVAKRATLFFDAPEPCEGRATFERRVRQRSEQIEFVEPPADHEVQVAVQWGRRSIATSPSLRATLRVHRPGESPLDRTISAATCEEALDALALMVAIALDPEGFAAASPSEEPNRASPRVESTQAAPPGDRWQGSLGAGVQAQGAAAPEWLLGPELAAGLHWLRESVWSPSLRVGLSRVQGDEMRAEGGSASFELGALSVDACPTRVAISAISLRPCLFGTYGRLRARGADTLDPRSVDRPWWVAGGSAWLAWEPTPFAALTATLRLGRPGVRDTFQFEPFPFHRVPAWSASGSLGLEVRFP